MGKKTKDSRRAMRKLKELLRDRPFGVGAAGWEDPNIVYEDWDGVIDDTYDNDDEGDDDKNLEGHNHLSLEIN